MFSGCGRSCGRGAGRLRQFLVFAETDGLRRAVLGDREILRGQAFDGVPFLVLHHHRLHHQLRADA